MGNPEQIERKPTDIAGGDMTCCRPTTRGKGEKEREISLPDDPDFSSYLCLTGDRAGKFLAKTAFCIAL